MSAHIRVKNNIVSIKTTHLHEASIPVQGFTVLHAGSCMVNTLKIPAGVG